MDEREPITREEAVRQAGDIELQESCVKSTLTDLDRRRFKFARMQDELGCDGCAQCDDEEFERGPCCLFWGGPKPTKQGQCQNRRSSFSMSDLKTNKQPVPDGE